MLDRLRKDIKNPPPQFSGEGLGEGAASPYGFYPTADLDRCVKPSPSPSLKGRGIVVALIIGLLCSRIAAGAQAADMQPAVCRITNQLNGMNNVGSGTLIDKADDGREGLVLTCAHLFHEGVGNIVVTFAVGRTHGAKLVLADRQADLAALAIANPRVEPAKVSLASSQRGQLFACGYGSNGRYRCAVGSGIGQTTSSGQTSLMISDSVRSGDSGGGVFNDQGRLVAVIWGESQGVTYASCGRPLQRFLGRVLGQRTSVVSDCPNGTCPQQQPTFLKPTPMRPPDPGLGEHSIVMNPRFGELNERIDRLEKAKQDRGDYVTRDFLNRVEDESKQRHATLLDRFRTLRNVGGAGLGRAAGKAALGFLGVSGPAGWGLLAATTIGGWLIGRRMKRKTDDARGRRSRPFPSETSTTGEFRFSGTE